MLGSCWRVAVGKNIRIFKDKWLRLPAYVHLIPQVDVEENMLIQELIDPDLKWRTRDLVEAMFCHDIAESSGDPQGKVVKTCLKIPNKAKVFAWRLILFVVGFFCLTVVKFFNRAWIFDSSFMGVWSCKISLVIQLKKPSKILHRSTEFYSIIWGINAPFESKWTRIISSSNMVAMELSKLLYKWWKAPGTMCFE